MAAVVPDLLAWRRFRQLTLYRHGGAPKQLSIIIGMAMLPTIPFISAWRRSRQISLYGLPLTPFPLDHKP